MTPEQIEQAYLCRIATGNAYNRLSAWIESDTDLRLGFSAKKRVEAAYKKSRGGRRHPVTQQTLETALTALHAQESLLKRAVDYYSNSDRLVNAQENLTKIQSAIAEITDALEAEQIAAALVEAGKE